MVDDILLKLQIKFVYAKIAGIKLKYGGIMTRLLLTLSVVSCLFSTMAMAKKCVENNSANCAGLGYTKSSCPYGGVACPFDASKWHCAEWSCEDGRYTDTQTTNNCVQVSYKGLTCYDCQKNTESCPSGELDPTCEDGFSKYLIATTESGKSCYECQPSTCRTAIESGGDDYEDKDSYFANADSSGFYLPEDIQSVELVNNQEYVTTECYKKCSGNLLLKPVTASNCSVGDWVIDYDSDIYCASSSKSVNSYSACNSFKIVGVVGYKSNNNVYAVYTTGLDSFTNATWNTYGSQCPENYRLSKIVGNFYYNAKVLLGSVTSSFSSGNCVKLSSGVISMLNFLSEYQFGIPNTSALTSVASNLSTINTNLQRVNLPSISYGSQNSGDGGTCNNAIWYDDDKYGIFDLDTTLSDDRQISNYTAFISSSGTVKTTCPLMKASEQAQGVLISNISNL